MDKETLNRFQSYLTENHYGSRTIEEYCEAIVELDINEQIIESKILYEHINSKLIAQAKHSSDYIKKCQKAASSRYFEMITGIHVRGMKLKPEASNSVDSILSSFADYSIHIKHMLENTAKAECSHVRNLLISYDVDTIEKAASITAKDIVDYISRNSFTLRGSSVGRYITSIRNFFRFLEYENLKINIAILNLPITGPDWKQRKLPTILTTDEEDRLRNHVFKENEREIRNKAILFLMLDLGLRCAEIQTLSLSDIHWHQGTILIHGSKNNADRELPLSKTSGQALEDYILNWRGKHNDSHVFLSVRSSDNHAPATIGSIRSIIRELYESESITGWWKGPHAIRRTVASKIYSNGNGLKTTADILGHKALESTTHYVRLDIENMRSIAKEWPWEVL